MSVEPFPPLNHRRLWGVALLSLLAPAVRRKASAPLVSPEPTLPVQKTFPSVITAQRDKARVL